MGKADPSLAGKWCPKIVVSVSSGHSESQLVSATLRAYRPRRQGQMHVRSAIVTARARCRTRHERVTTYSHTIRGRISLYVQPGIAVASSSTRS